jgi:hypothetical protein
VSSKLNKFYSIKPKVINLKPHTPFSSLKSNISGQLISLCGHVIRVSPAQPYVTIGAFKCSKCQSITRQTFVDGIFQPPTQCSTPKSAPPPSSSLPHLLTPDAKTAIWTFRDLRPSPLTYRKSNSRNTSILTPWPTLLEQRTQRKPQRPSHPTSQEPSKQNFEVRNLWIPVSLAILL